MIARESIVAEARKCLKTRFKHQGRLPCVGLDCVGLLVAVARGLGLEYVDRPAYSKRPDGKVLVETLRSNPCLAELSDPTTAQIGDVIVIEFAGPEWPQHVAILTDRGMIHTYATLRKVVEHCYDAHWRAHTTHAFAFKEAA
jgi:cell wall-associated NlpC family hydrolase